jgi:Carbonic anhydrase
MLYAEEEEEEEEEADYAIKKFKLIQNHQLATDTFTQIFPRNKAWAAATAHRDPTLFPTLAKQQKPEILWIGCSDSRVPETTLLDLGPGQVFVHRNIANVIHPGDLSAPAVLRYAVDELKVCACSNCYCFWDCILELAFNPKLCFGTETWGHKCDKTLPRSSSRSLRVGAALDPVDPERMSSDGLSESSLYRIRSSVL